MAGPEGLLVRCRLGRRGFGDRLVLLGKEREDVVHVDVIDGDLGLPVGLRARGPLRERELARADVGGLQAEAAFGVKAVGLRGVATRDGRLRDASFALAQADFADFKGDLDLAVLRAVRAGAVAAAGDDAQRAGERLFGQGSEVTL